MAKLYDFDYPFTMKYLLIVAAVIILVRIDLVLRFFEKKTSKLYTPAELVEDNGSRPSSIISFDADPNLKTSPKGLFLTFLSGFKSDPSEPLKDKALDQLRSNPGMFSGILDKELSGELEGMRNLLRRKNQLTAYFLLDLIQLLKGENAERAKTVLSTYMDSDLSEFFNVYQRSADVGCSIAVIQGDQIPLEEKYYELRDRLAAIETYFASDKGTHKVLAQNCLKMLRPEVEKLKVSVTDPLSLGDEAGPGEDSTVPPDEGAPSTVTLPTQVPLPTPVPDSTPAPTIAPSETSP